MKRALLAVPVTLLALALASCTGDQPRPLGPSSAAPAEVATLAADNSVDHAAEEGRDAGNGRPVISYDGLMVRRRVVIAVHTGKDADLEGIRTVLDAEAAMQSMALAPIPPTVLEPAVLQHVVPELIVALPPTATLEAAQAIADQASEQGTAALGAEHFHVLNVLVHDLKFAVTTADPAQIATGVEKEGILSDYLGNYTTETSNGLLTFSYTGPLLGDDVVENVRSAIARPGHASAQDITVLPRSTTGAGVDMENEPVWEPEISEDKEDHH